MCRLHLFFSVHVSVFTWKSGTDLILAVHTVCWLVLRPFSSMNEGIFYIYGVIDWKFYKVSTEIPQDRRRAVVQTPANRLMTQQAPCMYVDIIHHYPCVRHSLNGGRCPNLPAVVCSKAARRGRLEL